jgi:hypothetical protein
MKYAIYEDPVTRKFTLVRLPHHFIEGDPLTVAPTARWFETHAEAVAAVPELLNREE